MYNGLAAWHYKHRTYCENADFFATNGFEAVSMLGLHMDRVVQDPEQAKELARIIREHKPILTVHHKLPASHSEDDVAAFHAAIDHFGAWQKEYGLIHILSFDVPGKIRGDLAKYVDYVLENVPNCSVGLEDYCLNESEKLDVFRFKSEPRFGHLVDIGHLHIRLTAAADASGCVPVYEDYLAYFRGLEFPVWEMHLHNNNGKDDQHQFLPCGTLSIPDMAKLLTEINFDGVLTIESAPGYTFECFGEDADRGIFNDYEYWKKCLRTAKR